MIVGRKTEQALLKKAFKSDKSEFVAVYGRRRVGKTFLVRETFEYRFTFQHSGVAKLSMREQLKFFRESLLRSGSQCKTIPKDWTEAFHRLEELITVSNETKKIVFIDETPWMDTPRSGFITALEYFWNTFASARKDVMLIICGSATSWIINKVLKNHGGLHNRITLRISLQPFTLGECKEYIDSIGLPATYHDILEYYMVIGGVAFYWTMLDSGKSVAQNIDQMIFSSTGQLHNEFNELYDSLFSNPEPYLRIINSLGDNRAGLTRKELISKISIKSGSQITRLLEDLVECGFIAKTGSYGKNINDQRYKIIDSFTLFYFQFLKGGKITDSDFWVHNYLSPKRYSWAGIAFERVCFQHISQIKSKLGISGVATNAYSWQTKVDGNGAQIDLILERADNIINICEIKFSASKFNIDKDTMEGLMHKVERFMAVTKTRKAIHLTMVTTYGIVQNAYSNQINSEITAEDLFK